MDSLQEFERRKPEDDPADWFAYFDDAELAAELGHCNRDLGRAVDASVYAAQSIGANGEYVRSVSSRPWFLPMPIWARARWRRLAKLRSQR
jgi:hypothetical protein